MKLKMNKIIYIFLLSYFMLSGIICGKGISLENMRLINIGIMLQLAGLSGIVFGILIELINSRRK